jgi:hypothetical protein
MKKLFWIIIPMISLYSCTDATIDEQTLVIRNSRALPSILLTFQYDEGKEYTQELHSNSDHESDIILSYNPSLGRYTYLGSPVKKLYLNKSDYILFSENNVIYKDDGQKESTLIRNYNQPTFSLSNTIDFNGIGGGFPVFLETTKDNLGRKVIRIKLYQ